MVFEVAESGGKTGSLVKGVFINAKDDRALKRDPLIGFANGKLVVNAFDTGRSDFKQAREG